MLSKWQHTTDKWSYQQELLTEKMKQLSHRTCFGTTSTGTNDAGEQHMGVAGIYHMNSSELYIAQNVER